MSRRNREAPPHPPGQSLTAYVASTLKASVMARLPLTVAKLEEGLENTTAGDGRGAVLMVPSVCFTYSL